MSTLSSARLILIFAVAFSLASLAGPMSSNFHLPAVRLAHANLQRCETHGSSGACSEFWYPAGPEENTLLATIFADTTAELNDIQSATPSIDFTDSPLPASLIGTFNTSPNFLVTAPVSQVGYYEIEFHLGNTFWNCNFNFGNSACGIQIRQGIAHMIDKTAFTANQASIAGRASPIDNPLPTTSAGGLPSPNPCGYDTSFSQSGSQCVVGAQGGTSYHLATATGANGIGWLAGPGSADLNAAAQHFVNAGVAAGFNPATSILQGIAVPQCPNCPDFFVRIDNVPLLDLGNSMAEQICYLFTGAYTVPCNYLNIVHGPITAFSGFTTSPTSVNLSWGMYTAAYIGPTFFDGSLYSTYNSRFASASCASPGTVGCATQQIGGGSCSNQSLGTSSAADYLYACDPTYDNLSGEMEIAPCGVGAPAPGDPVAGATSNLPTAPGNGICTGTSQLSAHSAGIQAEVEFGSHVITLPVFQTTVQYGYLNNGWIRAINSAGVGLPNRFTWSNAWNAAPPQAGTIRQGFSQTTRSVNPYISSTPWDMYIEGSVYDSLYAADPLSPTQFMNWMTTTTSELTNSQVIASRGYTPPPGTLTTYEFVLRNDVYFQDQQPVTPFDVAFSYLSMVGTGALLGAGASTMTGITIINSLQFDIAVSSLGPFTLPNLTGIPIVPGRYWTNAGSSAWDSASMSAHNTYQTCGTSCPTVQYTLAGSAVNCALSCTTFPASIMTINSNDATFTFDPISSHTFVGSGPWQCGTGTLTTAGSKTCTSTGVQNPPIGGSYTLSAFGSGESPSTCRQSTCYFRSPANIALWLWTGMSSSDITNPQNVIDVIFACYGQPAVPLPPAGGPVPVPSSCAHYQQGIGANGVTTTSGTYSFTCPPSPPYNAPGHPECVPNGQPGGQTLTWTCSTTNPCGFMEGITQFSIVAIRYYNFNSVLPFNWAAGTPLGIGAFPPILYQGSTTLSPASIVGCSMPYPAGGYDC